MTSATSNSLLPGDKLQSTRLTFVFNKTTRALCERRERASGLTVVLISSPSSEHCLRRDAIPLALGILEYPNAEPDDELISGSPKGKAEHVLQ